MVAPRAAWKGFLKFGSVAFGVKVVGATSEAEKIRFRTLNRKTRNPVRSAFVDEGSGEVVEAADQVKGFEIGKGEFVQVEPSELKALKLTSDHTLDIEGFVPSAEIDRRYLDKPYFLVPADSAAIEGFTVFREALSKRDAVARSCIVLYQRGREVVIWPADGGLVMTTLRTHDQLLSSDDAFAGLGKIKTDAEMIEIAELLIDRKTTKFDPSAFEDRYEKALADLIDAKRKGKSIPKPAAPPKREVVNLAEVLRKSLKKEGIRRKGGQSKRAA